MQVHKLTDTTSICAICVQRYQDWHIAKLFKPRLERYVEPRLEANNDDRAHYCYDMDLFGHSVRFKLCGALIESECTF